MRAMRRLRSIVIAFIGERSISMPPSVVLCPAKLWPPLRTATARSCSRAKVMAAMTSVASMQRTIRAGYLSIMPFQTLRALS